MTRRTPICTFLTALLFAAPFAEAGTPPPQTTTKSILEGNARFEFLTPTLIRLEYSPTRSFVDAPSAVVLKRGWSPVDVRVTRKGSWLIATTTKLTLRYFPDSAGFSRKNLQITWLDGGAPHEWSPGDRDSLNLGGIGHSLDGAGKGKLPAIDPGILSRSGYFLLDDSRSPLEDSVQHWIVPRAVEASEDWYFFEYGKDYSHVLKEYSTLCGNIPMIPRYALGAWITDLNYEYRTGDPSGRNGPYSDADIREIVKRFRSENIPLDVLVLDFAWHRFGWAGGYDWSPIIHDPAEFLAWAHTQGLHVTLNDHPGYGGESVLSDEDSHAAEIRKRLHLAIPPKPTFKINLLNDWKFRADSDGVGLSAGWFKPDFDESRWRIIQAGEEWEDQGLPDYDGYAWYRKTIEIPPRGNATGLYLIFGGVDDEYDLFINGTKAAHYGEPGASVYNTVTCTDISRFVKPGEKALVTLRVNDWGGGGGITKGPVTLSDAPPDQGIRFNLAEKDQASAFMNVLHNPLIDQGVDFWWVDGGSGSSHMDGLRSQQWTNKVFYDFTEKHTGKRSLIFSRYGGWGDHRSPMLFTGDTHSEWDVLAYEVPFTARGGNVLVPYITHDIGGFLGKKIDFDLYTRWVQFGVVSPILRLHSEYENPRDGNLRLPWVYGDEGTDIVRELFQLRYRLIPYIYTYCRRATDEALPIVRPLYLEYPDLEAAYAHPDEYFFGGELLAAPVVDESNERDVYLPPGEWMDFFSGKLYKGGETIHVRSSLHSFPLYVRKGALIPGQPVSPSSDRTSDTLTVDIFGEGSSSFNLYEDDGNSLRYREGNCAWTPLAASSKNEGTSQLTLGPTKGSYEGQNGDRTYAVRYHGVSRPQAVEVSVDGQKRGNVRWAWDEQSRTLTLEGLHSSIRARVQVTLE